MLDELDEELLELELEDELLELEEVERLSVR